MNQFVFLNMSVVLLSVCLQTALCDIYGCTYVYKLFRKRSCFDKGHAVVFSFGDYYCCPEVSDHELLAMGASAWWRKGRGFCGRSSCDHCNDSQDCVVFNDEDVFCCSTGYSVESNDSSSSLNEETTLAESTTEKTKILNDTPVIEHTDTDDEDSDSTTRGGHHKPDEEDGEEPAPVVT